MISPTYVSLESCTVASHNICECMLVKCLTAWNTSSSSHIYWRTMIHVPRTCIVDDTHARMYGGWRMCRFLIFGTHHAMSIHFNDFLIIFFTNDYKLTVIIKITVLRNDNKMNMRNLLYMLLIPIHIQPTLNIYRRQYT
jgi:hypothetical protein